MKLKKAYVKPTVEKLGLLRHLTQVSKTGLVLQELEQQQKMAKEAHV